MNLGYGDEELPYNPRYDTLQHAKAGSGLATIPEDGPPPSEALDPVAFPEGPQEDDPESVSSTKHALRPSCGMFKFQIILSKNTHLAVHIFTIIHIYNIIYINLHVYAYVCRLYLATPKSCHLLFIKSPSIWLCIRQTIPAFSNVKCSTEAT